MARLQHVSSPALSSYGTTCRQILTDFMELPGLRLTSAQAQRLWSLEPFACEAMLGALVDAGFLVRGNGGTFARNDRVAPARRDTRPGQPAGRVGSAGPSAEFTRL